MTHALSKKSQSLPMIAKFRRGGVRLGISHRTILNRKRQMHFKYVLWTTNVLLRGLLRFISNRAFIKLNFC